MKRAIIGFGGFGREVFYHMINDGFSKDDIEYFVDDEYVCENTSKLSKLVDNIEDYEVYVAIGNPSERKKVVDKLPKHTNYGTFIHSSVIILDQSIKIGRGSIICAGCILTTNITIGEHAHLNLNSTIGHDVVIGDYFTTAPGVHISGNVNIGDNVYFGTNSACREKINIYDGVVVGLNGGVVKHLNESGIYVGVPVEKK